MDLAYFQSQPDPRLGYGEISPKLAVRYSRERRRTAGADGRDDFIRPQPGAGSERHMERSEYMSNLVAAAAPG